MAIILHASQTIKHLFNGFVDPAFTGMFVYSLFASPCSSHYVPFSGSVSILLIRFLITPHKARSGGAANRQIDSCCLLNLFVFRLLLMKGPLGLRTRLMRWRVSTPSAIKGRRSFEEGSVASPAGRQPRPYGATASLHCFHPA